MNQRLAEAIRWYGEGVSVIPVHNGTKVAAVRWTEYVRRLPTPDELVRWFERQNLSNYGVICGQRHGQSGHLAVVDFDRLDAGVNWLLSMRGETYTVATSRGLHAYFFTEEPAPTCHFDGGDVKGSGYVLGAGSVHPSGWVYQALTDAPIQNICSIREVLPDLPETPEARPKPPVILSNPVVQTPWDAAEFQRPNLVDTIRARFSLLDFLPDAQKTDGGGRWYVARCPLHDDHRPSMWIDAKNQICGCYAGCNGGRAMDVVNLMAQVWGVSNSDAIERLRQML